MIVLKVLGILFVIFLLLGFLRVGAIATFGDALTLRLRIGPLRVTLLPEKKKKPKTEKPPKEKPAAKEAPAAKKKHALPKPTIEELLDLASTAFSALGATARRLCRRLCIDPFRLSVCFGGYDPADIAQTYGMASAAMWVLMPKAEELFDLPNPSIHLDMDYDSQETRAEGMIGVSLRVCDLFAVAFTLLIPLVKWFLRLKKAHPADAGSAAAPDAQHEPEETEQISA